MTTHQHDQHDQHDQQQSPNPHQQQLPQPPQPRVCVLRRPFDRRCFGTAEVQIQDRYGTTAWGCITHASLALAGIPGSTIVDHTRHGSAIEAHRLAQAIRRDRRGNQTGGVTWW